MLKNITINEQPIKIRRALISVYDKTNIEKLARSLVDNGTEIITTGGTSETLINSNIPVSYTHLTLPTKA